MTAFEQLALDLGTAPQTTRAVKPKALRACPFCGRPVHVIMGGSIHCSTCRALVIIAGTGDDIINTWNKRRNV